ncbi:MAG: adenosylcobinamide-GDP ribazoletransferase [Proteobacteria bacterium]|nr:adenosylcobinamide-GDP ribazoletransferase [Pseudomonadota bacterium]
MAALADDLLRAFAILTRLPVADRGSDAAGRCVWAFPLAGGVVGALGAGVLFAAHQAGLYGLLAAGVALGAQIFVTGALHEDGLADVADGFGGGRNKADKLKIMRDSRIGVYGVIALILVLGLRWNAIAALGLAEAIVALIAAGVLGRLAIVSLPVLLAPARPSGFGATIANPPAAALAGAVLIGLALTLALLPPIQCAAISAVMLVCAVVFAWLANKQIGGYTGDVLGACEQSCETAILLTLVAMA